MKEIDQKILSLIDDLNNALKRLNEVLNIPINEIIRDSIIQRFEFSFELSWKLMKSVNKWLGTDLASPRENIRSAAQNKLINNPEIWLNYLTARNMATHVYDEKMANEAMKVTEKFPIDSRLLINNIQKIIQNY